jgi:hypothetical protein
VTPLQAHARHGDKSVLGAEAAFVEGSPALSASVETPQQFKLCSECKKPIAFTADYFRCSVSTCNRKRTGLYFCSVPCWDAHVPMMRHRDAWAEAARAPTREAYLAELAEEAEERREAEEREARAMSEEGEKGRRIVGLSDEGVPKEVLIVVSKLKGYIKARSGMSTSDGVIDVLSQHLRELCDDAIRHAGTAGRKTVMDRDFTAAFPAKAEPPAEA